jgi:phosphoserine aminotransferase
MKKTFFTPGPSELYFTYEDHLRTALRLQIGSISHREMAFTDLYKHTVEQLSQLLELPSEYKIVFCASATECWERAAQNLIGGSAHHFVHGDFGMKFYKVAADYGKQAMLAEITDDFLPIACEAEFIALAMNETSTGFQHTSDDILQMRALNPNALIALDVVSATPAIEVDFSLVDTAYFSVQKCFGLPAGLGVWIVNERAIESAKKLNHPSYHSLESLLKMGAKNQTPETPNVMNIYLLGKVAEDMNRRGIKTIRNEINYKAALLYQTIENHPKLEISIKNKAHRSKTTIVADCAMPNDALLSAMEAKGYIIGSGYGQRKDDQIRIANFPTHSKEQVEILCDSLMNFA